MAGHSYAQSVINTEMVHIPYVRESKLRPRDDKDCPGNKILFGFGPFLQTMKLHRYSICISVGTGDQKKKKNWNLRNDSDGGYFQKPGPQDPWCVPASPAPTVEWFLEVSAFAPRSFLGVRSGPKAFSKQKIIFVILFSTVRKFSSETFFFFFSCGRVVFCSSYARDANVLFALFLCTRSPRVWNGSCISPCRQLTRSRLLFSSL